MVLGCATWRKRAAQKNRQSPGKGKLRARHTAKANPGSACSTRGSGPIGATRPKAFLHGWARPDPPLPAGLRGKVGPRCPEWVGSCDSVPGTVGTRAGSADALWTVSTERTEAVDLISDRDFFLLLQSESLARRK
jgi:hypothetical protein